MTDLQTRPSLAPHVRLQEDPVTGEPVLLYPEGLLVLNATAHAIVVQCDGSATIRQILETLANDYEVAPEELEADVLECLQQLNDRQLIKL